MATKRITKKFGTKAVRLSYANLDKPRVAMPGQDAKYSCVLMIPKSDTDTLKKLRAAMTEIVEQNSMLSDYDPKTLIAARLRDGAGSSPTGKKYQEAYKDFYVLNANNTRKPVYQDVDGTDLIDPGDTLYSGCWAKVGITLYPFSNPQNSGIGVSLDVIRKIRDDEQFGGVIEARDYFDDDDDDDDDI